MSEAEKHGKVVTLPIPSKPIVMRGMYLPEGAKDVGDLLWLVGGTIHGILRNGEEPEASKIEPVKPKAEPDFIDVEAKVIPEVLPKIGN